MDADRKTLTLEGIPGLADEFVGLRNEWRPGFAIALACAVLMHAALIAWVGRAPARYIGAPGGSANAINVEIVDAAELLERASGAGASEASGAEAAPAGAQAVQTPAPPPEPEKPVVREETDARDAVEAAPAQKQAAVPAPSTDVQEPSPPDDVLKQGERTPQPKQESKPEPAPKKSKRDAAPEQKLAAPQLDLSVPLGLTLRESASVGSSAATRPAGTTRSAENDRFGRDVIKALRKTMPPQRDMIGRVTVRIFLDQRGNISKVTLVQSSGDPLLPENVLFSVRQASFPYPPKGATRADLTFLITYNYH